jgi:hypothetical protein
MGHAMTRELKNVVGILPLDIYVTSTKPAATAPAATHRNAATMAYVKVLNVIIATVMIVILTNVYTMRLIPAEHLAQQQCVSIMNCRQQLAIIIAIVIVLQNVPQKYKQRERVVGKQYIGALAREVQLIGISL